MKKKRTKNNDPKHENKSSTLSTKSVEIDIYKRNHLTNQAVPKIYEHTQLDTHHINLYAPAAATTAFKFPYVEYPNFSLFNLYIKSPPPFSLSSNAFRRTFPHIYWYTYYLSSPQRLCTC